MQTSTIRFLLPSIVVLGLAVTHCGGGDESDTGTPGGSAGTAASAGGGATGGASATGGSSGTGATGGRGGSSGADASVDGGGSGGTGGLGGTDGSGGAGGSGGSGGLPDAGPDSERSEAAADAPIDANSGALDATLDERTAPLAAKCIETGGQVQMEFCCIGLSDLPESCVAWPCTCGPNSHNILICECPGGSFESCFEPDLGCRRREGGPDGA